MTYGTIVSNGRVIGCAWGDNVIGWVHLDPPSDLMNYSECNPTLESPGTVDDEVTSTFITSSTGQMYGELSGKCEIKIDDTTCTPVITWSIVNATSISTSEVTTNYYPNDNTYPDYVVDSGVGNISVTNKTIATKYNLTMGTPITFGLYNSSDSSKDLTSGGVIVTAKCIDENNATCKTSPPSGTSTPDPTSTPGTSTPDKPPKRPRFDWIEN
ncbi:MAG: hypothetical protein AAB693_01245 [Patescibacteria group bacterium]